MIEDSHDSGQEAILGLSARFRLWLPAPHTGEIRPRKSIDVQQIILQ